MQTSKFEWFVVELYNLLKRFQAKGKMFIDDSLYFDSVVFFRLFIYHYTLL